MPSPAPASAGRGGSPPDSTGDGGPPAKCLQPRRRISDNLLFLGISNSQCYAIRSSLLRVRNGNYFYVDGCAAGDGVLEIRDQSTNELLNIYLITVHPK